MKIFEPGKVIVYSGKEIDILNIKSDDVDIFDIAHSLSNICRFNGHTSSFYSVAEHSVRGTYLLNERREKQLFLLHDAAEAYFGDIVRGIKYITQLRDIFKTIERRIEIAVLEHFGIPGPVSDELTYRLKYADDTMLRTEARDLFSGLMQTFYTTTNAEPLPLIITPWTSEIAKEQFLLQAASLGIFETKYKLL